MKTYSKYKDSGIDWIGEIPIEWEIKRNKDMAVIVTGATPKSSKIEYWENGDINWATPIDLGQNSRIFKTKRKITQLGLDNCGAEMVPIGSVVMATRAPIGYITFVENEISFNQGCKALKFTKNIYPNFVFYYLKSSENILQSLGQGTTFMELPTKRLSAFNLLIPPFPEQEKIAEFLDDKNQRIDKTIKNKYQQIELLKERKLLLMKLLQRD